MTKKREKVDRMAEIVAAAVDEFLQHGYEKASMDAIARRANISKGGLYHHFSGKRAILLYANQKLSVPIAGLMETASRNHSAAMALRGYIHDYLAYWHERPRELVFFFLAMTQVLENNELWQYYADFTEQTIGFIESLLQRGVAQHELQPHDVRARAVALMAALDGVLGYLVIDTQLRVPDVIAGFAAIFIDSLKLADKEHAS
jgi:AcrR family transcriptional regulator